MRSVFIFEGLIDAQIRTVSSICQVMNVRAGEIVFEQGVRNRALYMLLQGKVEILSGPEQIVVGRVLAGDILGEISLVEDTEHWATARAKRDRQFIIL